MLNKCQFIGRLGKDPEIRTLENGQAVANLSIACSEKWKDKTTGEAKEKTEWVNLVAWSPLSDKVIAKYVHKGDLIYVEGKMQTRSWEKDGVTRYTTEVLVSNLVMLSSKNSNGAGGGEYRGDDVQKQYNAQGNNSKPPAGNTFTGGSNATDDLPF